ncbi:reverse transcriptase domain-containing protein [Tanacetum coccineum]
MSTHEQITNNPTSAVRNTGVRNGPQGLEEPMSDEILWEMCDKNYHQLLPLIAEKMQKEKEQKDKLNAVKARLIYGEESGIKIRSREESHYSESKTPTARTEPRRRHGDRKKEACLIGWEERSQLHPHVLIVDDEVPKQKELKLKQEGVNKGEHHLVRLANTQKVKIVKGDTGSPNQEDRDRTLMRTISLQPGLQKKPFTPRIRHFSLPRTRMPSHVKTYDGSGDPEDHLKLFQSTTKTEGWAMPIWCHMFNSTLTGNARVWFDKLPKESIDSYEDLRTAFKENYLQQTKHIKDPVEIHHIKKRDGESMEDFMER